MFELCYREATTAETQRNLAEKPAGVWFQGFPGGQKRVHGMVEGFELATRYGMRTEEFKELMSYRVREILLVASHYDAFVLEEDGQLTELIFEEYRNLDLNLRFAPRFTRAADGAKALELLEKRSFDMVVASPRLADLAVEEFAHQVKQHNPEVPVSILAAHAWDLPQLQEVRASGDVDWLFLWQGDVKALLALIKQIEDRRNADQDVLEGGVQAIILVEDSVRFYSAYLPNIYTEVTLQTGRLMAEGLNLSHRLLRIRARPKILLAQTFEEAVVLYTRYAGKLLGVISDLSFPRDGRLDPEAGLALARLVRSKQDDVPILLQSTNRDAAQAAETCGATFVYKNSPRLLEDIRSYILENFGFGDFVFKLPDGSEVGRARDMRELVRELERVPDESIYFHAGRNHFSSWLKARTEFELASMLRPRKVSEFGSTPELRTYLISTIRSYLRSIQRHIITDFDPSHFDRYVTFAKVGGGSMGGKGRGLAFVQKMLAQEPMALPGVEVAIPQTVVVASDIFEEFIEDNAIRNLVGDGSGLDDHEILDAVRGGRFAPYARSELASLLQEIHHPLAIRSSSILEDSLYQPFAGVYATVMLPNNHPSLDVRLAQLLEAIKVVYASTFFSAAREYLHSTDFRVEEERMAVLLQRLVGSRHGDHFYPTLSGVASSYNFYPFGDMRPEDGVAQIALGLGKSVVEGFEALRFCPRHPQLLPQFSAVKDILRNAQRRFYALDMKRDDILPGVPEDANLVYLETVDAMKDRAAPLFASTYLPANDTISSGVVRGGSPLVTFAPLLKGRLIPMPKIISRFLELAQHDIGCPVEAEFAMDLARTSDGPPVFHFLQIRPMLVEAIRNGSDLDDKASSKAVVFSEQALGHGRRSAISDLVVIWPGMFDRADASDAAMVIEKINRELRQQGRRYALIGPGRWGSRDPWLGIPVTWSQISAVRAIVETDFKDLEVEPSQGSHFFHNITCFGIAYFTIHEGTGHGRVDWQWLEAQPTVSQELGGAIRHIRLEEPVETVVDGSSGRGAILPTCHLPRDAP